MAADDAAAVPLRERIFRRVVRDLGARDDGASFGVGTANESSLDHAGVLHRRVVVVEHRAVESTASLAISDLADQDVPPDGPVAVAGWVVPYREDAAGRARTFCSSLRKDDATRLLCELSQHSQCFRWVGCQ